MRTASGTIMQAWIPAAWPRRWGRSRSRCPPRVFPRWSLAAACCGWRRPAAGGGSAPEVPPYAGSMATVFLNGRFVEPGDARVSAFDAGFQHGVGVFDTMIGGSGDGGPSVLDIEA